MLERWGEKTIQQYMTPEYALRYLRQRNARCKIIDLQNIINSIFNNITSVQHKNEYELLFQSDCA